jgi:hypothetical protein
MDRQPPQPDNEPDELDRLLGQARWPEPSVDTLRRLRSEWSALTERSSGRRRLRWALLAAAGIVAAAGVAFWAAGQRTRVGPQPVATAIARHSSTSGKLLREFRPLTPGPSPASGEGSNETAPEPKRPSAVRSRAPNTYEQMVAARYRLQCRRLSVAATQVASEPNTAATVAEAIPHESPHGPSAAGRGPGIDRPQDTRLRREIQVLLARKNRAAVQTFLEHVADIRTSAVALSCLDTAPEPPAEMFLKFLHSRSASQRVAAALALGRLNQPAISRQLIATVLRGSCRQEALMALLASSEPSAQQFVMAAARDPLLSATLYSAQRHIQQFSSWGS